MLRAISTPDAPNPVGHYSQGIYDGHYLFVSGQLGMDPQTGKVVETHVAGQMAQALQNVAAVLKQAGGSFQDVVKSTIFFSNVDDWAVINSVYAQYFGDHRPARSAVPSGTLPLGALLEIEVIARIDKDATTILHG
jgi:2-iminobutanoate/2-iminopropanoate deaminase